MILLITEVTVPSSYEYIKGTVNDTNTSFVADTIIEGLCLCSCEESSSYVCVLNFYDEDDTIISTVNKTITQATNTFVLDRTQADVDYAKNLLASGRANEASDLKGCLNTSDLTRTLNNFRALGVLDHVTMSIPNIPDFPDRSFFEILKGNMQLVKANGYQLDTSPSIPDFPFNDFAKWNDIEHILWDNFDIRTTRFEYYGLPMRTTSKFYPLVYRFNNTTYQGNVEQFLNFPTQNLSGKSFISALLDVQQALGVVEED